MFQSSLAVAVDVELNFGINAMLDAIWHVICTRQYLDRLSDLYSIPSIRPIILHSLQVD
jgi:hypothetical protein